MPLLKNSGPITVLDNWLDPVFCEQLANHILYGMPHKYGCTSFSESVDKITEFYMGDFDFEDFHIKYMCYKLSQEVFKRTCKFSRVHANIQFNGMDGSFHKDDGDFTVLYMVTPTLDGVGHFEYQDEGVKQVDFVQNRLAIFRGSDIVHRGMSPNIGPPRITVSFKVNEG